MATSFRFTPDETKKLEYLARRLGKPKAQVVKQALNMFYEQETKHPKRSTWDRLIEGGFEPIEVDLGFDCADVDKQRQIIHERITKKYRR